MFITIIAITIVMIYIFVYKCQIFVSSLFSSYYLQPILRW